jgi:hypothetical protein
MEWWRLLEHLDRLRRRLLIIAFVSAENESMVGIDLAVAIGMKLP